MKCTGWRLSGIPVSRLWSIKLKYISLDDFGTGIWHDQMQSRITYTAISHQEILAGISLHHTTFYPTAYHSPGTTAELLLIRHKIQTNKQIINVCLFVYHSPGTLAISSCSCATKLVFGKEQKRRMLRCYNIHCFFSLKKAYFWNNCDWLSGGIL